MTDAINWHPNGTPGPWNILDNDVVAGEAEALVAGVYSGGYPAMTPAQIVAYGAACPSHPPANSPHNIHQRHPMHNVPHALPALYALAGKA